MRENNVKMSVNNDRISVNHEVNINVKVYLNNEVCKEKVNINIQIHIKANEFFVCNVLIT